MSDARTKLLAGTQFNDMAAMDRYINRAKGQYYKGDGPAVRGPNALSQASRNIQDFGIAAAAIGDPDFVQLFQRTHQRLYDGFREIDNAILAANCPGAVNTAPEKISATWANAYSMFLTS